RARGGTVDKLMLFSTRIRRNALDPLENVIARGIQLQLSACLSAGNTKIGTRRIWSVHLPGLDGDTEVLAGVAKLLSNEGKYLVNGIIELIVNASRCRWPPSRPRFAL